MRHHATLAVLIPLIFCAGDGNAEIISGCGEVVRGDDCLQFTPLDKPEVFGLPDSLEVESWGVYHITGETYNGSPVCGNPFYSRRLRNVVAAPCPLQDFGCGVIRLWEDGHDRCILWSALSGETTFTCDDLGEYAVGDTVTALAIPCYPLCVPIPGTCADFGLGTFELQFAPCADTLNPAEPTTWGAIKSMYRR